MRLCIATCFVLFLVVLYYYSYASVQTELLKTSPQLQHQQQQHIAMEQQQQKTISSSPPLPVPNIPVNFFEHFEEDLIIHDVDEEEEEDGLNLITQINKPTTPSPTSSNKTTPSPVSNALPGAEESPAKDTGDDDEEDMGDDHLDLLEEDDAEAVVVDEDAHDVLFQPAHNIDDDDYQELLRKVSNKVPLPRYSLKHLESLGFGKFLLVYRVISSSGVYVRSRPHFLASARGGGGGGNHSTAESIIKEFKPQGQVVVGYKLLRENNGLWLKLSPNRWISITNSQHSGKTHKLMKQIMTISLPSNLHRYWTMDPTKSCSKPTTSDIQCKEKNEIRRGVLQIMRDLHIMTPAMDPDANSDTGGENGSLEDDDEVVEEEEDEDQINNSSNNNNSSECHGVLDQEACVLAAKCEWDVETGKCDTLVPAEISHPTRFDFQNNATRRYLVYQPMATSDWNVQRIQFENSLVLCKLLNRTCIAPPVHSATLKFVAMSRLLNFDVLTEFVSVETVPQHVSLAEFREQRMNSTQQHKVKQISQAINKYSEHDVITHFGRAKEQFLYFSNLTIGSFDWKGSAQGFPQRRIVHLHLMYADHVKQAARRVSQSLGPYHAVHIHQIAMEKTRELDWWFSSLANYSDMTEDVYVVNPHGQRAKIEPIAHKHGLRPMYLADMHDINSEVVKPYLEHFPEPMHGMITGMIEQLVAGYAIMFLGSGSSPFTAYVLRLRKFRETLATDTRFEDAPLGLPAIVRNLKTNCEPIRVVYHVTPC